MSIGKHSPSLGHFQEMADLLQSGEAGKGTGATAGHLLSSIHHGFVTPDQIGMSVPELELMAGRRIGDVPS
jgi:hypothetical protein